MARIVFVLGAGASAHTGAPLMGNFYRAITDLYDDPKFTEHREDFKLVIRCNKELDNVYAKVHMGYHENIENLLATFEMASIIGRLGNLPSSDLSRLTKAMKCVITTTIERSQRYKYIKGQGFKPHSGYLEFAKSIKDIMGNDNADIAILTFNYDYALEFAFNYADIPLSYCLEGTESSGIPYLKLHGSLNWGQCKKCHELIPYSIGEWASHPKNAIALELPDCETPLDLSKRIETLQHCGKILDPDPFIVPPTWNKTNYRNSLERVWQRAAKELASARAIFMIGYSFPQTDEFFRHLMALSLAGGPLIDIFAIVNTDPNIFENVKRWVGDKLQHLLIHISERFEISRPWILDTLKQR